MGMVQMAIAVGLLGGTRLAKRLADAIATQSDMMLSSVSGWSNLTDLAAARGYDVVESAHQLASACDVLIDARGTRIHVFAAGRGVNLAQQNNVVAFTSLTTELPVQDHVPLIIPRPDALALARVVQALRGVCNIMRLYTTILSRASHASEAAEASLDALEPVVDATEQEAELKVVFHDVISICQARRIVASYTHSHLHMIKLDVAGVVDREAVVVALTNSPRILVGTAHDGFRSTADINEFFRDLGRSRGDRWETFVWDESIMVVDQSVYMMLDISPEAVSVPEVVDAVRVIGRRNLDLDLARQHTDQSLGLLPSITMPREV